MIQVTRTLFLTIALSTLPAFAATPTLDIAGSQNASSVRAQILGGPLRADQKTLEVRLDAATVAPVVEPLKATERTQESGYYTEARGLRSVKLILNFWRSTEVEIPLDLSSDLNRSVAVDGIFDSVMVYLVGEKDLFKCFDPATCVPAGSVRRSVTVVRDESLQVKQFDSILSCGSGEAVVESKIGSPETQRLLLKSAGAAQYLQMSQSEQGRGDAASTGAEFVGFAAPLLRFGSSSDGPAYRTAHVFPVNGGLKVKVDTLPHFFCHFQYGESYITQATPTGQSCGYVSGYTYTHASPGADQAYSRDWFFNRCVELK